MKKILIKSGVDMVAVLSLKEAKLRQSAGSSAPPFNTSFTYPEIIDAVDNIIKNDENEPRKFTSQAEILAYEKNGFKEKGEYHVFDK